VALSREEIEEIAQVTAQEVINKLHRYAMTFQMPASVAEGLRESMGEELTAADWYLRRAKNARVVHGDEETAKLYEDIAKDEAQDHYVRFGQRLEEITR
jgi:rubrerythrin